MRQIIRVADQHVELPPGVNVADWAIERVRWQNPRIRAFLGCIRLLDGVLESNYAILHSSPERLLEIWRKVREVSQVIRGQLTPLVRAGSALPKLEEARQRVELAADMLSRTVLADLDRFPETLPEGRVLEVRKLLCVSIGQMHAFLTDSFGRIVAGDPRSLHNADYYLSRRFPRDIEEAEWLHFSVARLRRYADRQIEPLRESRLSAVARTLRDGALPSSLAWTDTQAFLRELIDTLAPRLKELLALRGIRFEEMEIVDRYAVEIPARCRMASELHAAAGEEGIGPALPILTRRAAMQLEEVDRFLRDLKAFVPLWLAGIEGRRALLLVRSSRDGHEDDRPPAPRDTRPSDFEDDLV
jgi:hypothetical protein